MEKQTFCSNFIFTVEWFNMYIIKKRNEGKKGGKKEKRGEKTGHQL